MAQRFGVMIEEGSVEFRNSFVRIRVANLRDEEVVLKSRRKIGRAEVVSELGSKALEKAIEDQALLCKGQFEDCQKKLETCRVLSWHFHRRRTFRM